MPGRAVGVDIDGIAELRAGFTELQEVTQRTVLRRALAAGAEPVVEEAQRLAPRRSGDLARGIAARVSVRKTQAEAVISFAKEQFYGRFVETGTSKLPARPFLRPALDTRSRAATERIGEALGSEIERAAARTRRRTARNG